MFAVHENQILEILGFWPYMALQTVIRRQILANFTVFIYRAFIGHKEMLWYLIEYGVHFVKNSVGDAGAYMASYTGGFGMIGCIPCIIIILHLMTISAK
jgi:hypothetical protein